MPIPGYIYVFVNSSMPGMVMVGRTEVPPIERAAALSRLTAVPTPFVHVFDAAFEDSEAAESAVCSMLDDLGARTTPGREFFAVAASDAIDIIRLVQDKSHDAKVAINSPVAEPRQRPTREPWRDVYEEAVLLLFGGERVKADPKRALTLLESAANLGSSSAVLRLGEAYLRGLGCEADDHRALQYLEGGARAGHSRCYGKLVQVYGSFITSAESNNTRVDPTWHENVRRCYFRYFTDLVVNDFEEEDEAAGVACSFVLAVAAGEVEAVQFSSFASIQELALLRCSDLSAQWRRLADGCWNSQWQAAEEHREKAKRIDIAIQQLFGSFESISFSAEAVEWRLGYFEWMLDRARQRSDVELSSDTQWILGAFERYRMHSLERDLKARRGEKEIGELRRRIDELTDAARTLRNRIGGESTREFIANLEKRSAERKRYMDEHFPDV